MTCSVRLNAKDSKSYCLTEKEKTDFCPPFFLVTIILQGFQKKKLFKVPIHQGNCELGHRGFSNFLGEFQVCFSLSPFGCGSLGISNFVVQLLAENITENLLCRKDEYSRLMIIILLHLLL